MSSLGAMAIVLAFLGAACIPESAYPTLRRLALLFAVVFVVISAAWLSLYCWDVLRMNFPADEAARALFGR